jgi:hypothetical protein
MIINLNNNKINRKTFILGRGLNLLKNDKIINNNNKKKINTLPLEHQMFLKSLINKTGKGFKKI